MKYLLIAACFAFTVLTASFFTEDAIAMCGSCGVAGEEKAGEEKSDENLKHIDTEDVSEEGGGSGSEFTESEGVPSEESYDTNTGLPDVTSSDKEWVQ